MPAPPLTTRFAPSPTGLLHLGSAYAALFAWRRARDRGGSFRLRLEDIDPARCRPDYAEAIPADLAWLGLDWDGPIRIQSHHLADYRASLDRLDAQGLLYPCFCSRADIAAAAAAPHQTPDGATLYPGTCRHLPRAEAAARLAQGHPHALRLDTRRALARTGPLTYCEEAEGRLPCDPTPFGDPVLARRDIPASYHLCVTHDDAAQSVTLVTRAQDLRPATALHRLLQTLLGFPEPGYAHHPLLTDDHGNRLAKRDRATSLQALRDQGADPAELRARLLSPRLLAPRLLSIAPDPTRA